MALGLPTQDLGDDLLVAQLGVAQLQKAHLPQVEESGLEEVAVLSLLCRSKDEFKDWLKHRDCDIQIKDPLLDREDLIC